MTKNDKVLLVFCFIVGCIVTAFISGCSKPKTVTYNPIKVEEETSQTIIDPLSISTTNDSNEETFVADKLIVYTGLTSENVPVKMASCKGCHFSCPHCVEE